MNKSCHMCESNRYDESVEDGLVCMHTYFSRGMHLHVYACGRLFAKMGGMGACMNVCVCVYVYVHGYEHKRILTYMRTHTRTDV